MTTQGKERGICVIGTMQTDYYASVKSFPKEGETLLASSFVKLAGGKSQNQVMMISKLMETEDKIVFITCVGNDDEGIFLKNHLKSIDTSHCSIIDGTTTISQNIVCDNVTTTILVPGSDIGLTKEHVDRSWGDVVKKCAVLLCGLDLGYDLTLYALKKAKSDGLITIFNPTPVTNLLEPEIYKYCDIICPNEAETEILTGIPVHSKFDAWNAGQKFIDLGVSRVVMTLGSKGIAYVDGNNKNHFSVSQVNVVDRSGAGDCFVGSLAYFVASSIPITDAINLASYLATISVQFVGIQASYPSRSEIY